MGVIEAGEQTYVREQSSDGRIKLLKRNFAAAVPIFSFCFLLPLYFTQGFHFVKVKIHELCRIRLIYA